MQREILEFYEKNFGDLILLDGGKKTEKKWQRLSVEEAEEKLKQGLNIGVKWNGNGFVDLDLDSPEAIFFARTFSNTNGWFNKKGRGHLIFRTSWEVNKQFTFNGKVYFETRAKNILTMMPPSKHPETLESLQWCKPLTLESIQEIEPEGFEKLLQKIYLCCVVSQFWYEGIRQNLAIRIGAFLLRQDFLLEEVEDMISAICEFCNDKEVNQRIAGIKNTAKRLQKLLPVAGLPSLKGYLPDEVIERIYNIFNIHKGTSTFNLDKIEKAENILKHQDVLGTVCSEFDKIYYERRKEKKLLYLLTQFRKLNMSTIAIISGDSSVGKSSLVDLVIKAVNERDTLAYTYTSEKFFLYLPAELRGKILVIYELKGANALPFLKTFITEREASLGSVMKYNNELKAVEVKKNTEGLVIFSTTTSTITDEELSSRGFIITLDPPRNISEILKNKYKQTEGVDYELLKIIDLLIKPHDVELPYIDELIDAFPDDKPRRLRDFEKFLNLIKAHALIHQYQREIKHGKVIATLEDLKAIIDLSELIFESFSELPKHLREFLEWIGDQKPYEEILRYPCKSKRQVRRYIDKLLKSGYLEKDTLSRTLTVVDLPAVVRLKNLLLSDVKMSQEQISLKNQEISSDISKCHTMSRCHSQLSQSCDIGSGSDTVTCSDIYTCPPSKQGISTISNIVDKMTWENTGKDNFETSHKALSDEHSQRDVSVKHCHSSICDNTGIKLPSDVAKSLKKALVLDLTAVRQYAEGMKVRKAKELILPSGKVITIYD